MSEESPTRPEAAAPVPPEAVALPPERRDAGLRPEHLYRAVALAFVLAVFFRFFDALTRVLLLIYAAAIIAVALNAIRRVVPIQRKWLAIVVGLLGVGIFVGVLLVGGPILFRQARGLVDTFPAVIAQVNEWIGWVEAQTGISLPLPESVGDIELGAMAGGGMASMWGRVVTVLEVLFIPVILFFGGLFALAGPNKRLLNPVLRVVPRDLRLAWTRIFQLLGDRLLGWLQGTALAMLGVGLLSTLALAIIGVPNWLALGMVNGLVEFIPLLGPWIGGVIATLVAVVSDPMKGLWTALAMIVIQQIESNVITPWAMSRGAEIHPFITLFALLLFGSLFGLLGIFLALPLVLLVWTVVQVLWVERTIDTDTDAIAPVVKE